MSRPRIRHVWARPNGPTPLPGLLLGWQKKPDDSWAALVTYVTPQERIVTEWVGVDQLQPAVIEQPHLGTAYG